MPFDANIAAARWAQAFRDDAWNDKLVLLEIAAESGLGVLTTDAMDRAMRDVRAIRKRLADASPDEQARVAAAAIFDAASTFPAVHDEYPLQEPEGHRVGVPPCFDRQRKGAWTSQCMRAAWGNIAPYGLAHAEKPCPGCGRPMRYWCQTRKRGEAFRWTVDHRVAHAVGGCVCRFNLAALCPSCNTAKGKRHGPAT